jgi:NADH-quinone oxidoreductase subunit L
MSNIKELVCLVIFLPLLGSVVSRLFGNYIGRSYTHRFVIFLMFLSTFVSIRIFCYFYINNCIPFDISFYTWATTGNISIEVGFLLDKLTVFMMLIVTFVSFMVHIYTIGYMKDDSG